MSLFTLFAILITVKPSSMTSSTRPPANAGWMISLDSLPVTVSQDPNSQASRVHGRTQRAQAASVRPSIRAASARNNFV